MRIAVKPAGRPSVCPSGPVPNYCKGQRARRGINQNYRNMFQLSINVSLHYSNRMQDRSHRPLKQQQQQEAKSPRGMAKRVEGMVGSTTRSDRSRRRIHLYPRGFVTGDGPGRWALPWRVEKDRPRIDRTKRLCVDHLNQLGRNSVGNTFNKTIEILSIIFKKNAITREGFLR